MPGCGSCNLCCRLLGVPDIQKPPRMLCWWTGVHGGCSRHADKETDPTLAACGQFKCVWLASQTRVDPTQRGSRALRPDQCHVVLGPQDRDDPTLLYVQVDPDYPDAWKKPLVAAYLDEMRRLGARLEIIVDEKRIEMPAESSAS